ncbi:hypothetical protein A9P82_10480 [Arachidicoccus ginsenosidimutans]|uniref:Kelch repeat-containing protein n=1 Tax=Arachidicoccus sp. BS20 TaxID=1850526 RepID=UPI0007F0EA23|nr:kelch repeat-containing protein [Arachidicoccus sp. BS20]ANI89676.1 hypothetical protein A9P82_10480 [Arachidicoccus sp. BS20]
MKKLNLIVLIGAAALFLASCNSSSSTDTSTEGNWVKRSSLDGDARFYATSFVIGNYAYVATGRAVNNSTYYNLGDLWRYDPSSDSWTQETSLPDGKTLEGGVGFSIGDNGYVGTGTDGKGNYYSDFYQYSSTSNTWTKIADFPGTARFRATGFSVGDKGYVVFGAAGSAYFKDMYAYDPNSDSWTNISTPFIDKKYGGTSFVIGDDAYLVGGTIGDGSGSGEFWKYNPSSGFTQLRRVENATDSSFDDDYGTVRASLISRTDGVAFAIGSKGYITGGKSSDGGSFSSQTWCYDPTGDKGLGTWEQRTSYERHSFYGGVGFNVNGRGFAGLGFAGSSLPYDNLDEFLPTEDYNVND